MASFSENIRRFFEGIRDETQINANTATRIGRAFLILWDYLIDFGTQFLRKDIDDTAAGKITFEKGLRVKPTGESTETVAEIDEHGNASFLDVDVEGEMDVNGKAVVNDDIRSKNFATGTTGWKIDPYGNAEVESLRARSFIWTEEMLINRLQAQEGDTLFTDNDQVEAVRSFEDETDHSIHYVLTLKEKWEGYFTSQQYGNIVKGIVNTFAAKSAGVSNYTSQTDLSYQEQDNGGNYFYTSWMRVVATHNTSDLLGVNEIEVVLYGDTDVPAQKNFPPCELMTIARRGCYLNPQDYAEGSAERQSIERRQRLWEISVTDGRITKLAGVMSPMLVPGNYGITMGELPDFVKNIQEVADLHPDGKDFVYADGLVVGKYLKINKAGLPIPENVLCDRDWVDGSTIANPVPGYGIYYANKWNEENQRFETHIVSHRGMQWQCLESQPVVVNGVNRYYEPKWNSAYWRLVDGNENLTLEFVSSRGYSFRRGHVDTVVTPHLFYGTIDITEDVAAEYWNWTRMEEANADREGDARYTASDLTWNELHRGARTGRKTLPLTQIDLPAAWSTSNKAIYTCIVIVNDGKTTTIVENQIIS